MERDYFGENIEKLLRKVITYLLINLLSCHGFMKNLNSAVI